MRRDGQLIIDRGRRINSAVKSTLSDILWPDPMLPWEVKFSVPYTQAASKNFMYRAHAEGRADYRSATNDFIAEVADRARSAKIKAVEGKVWVSIFVQKPNHRSDAINVIGSVCDGLKTGLGVDDRWFSIRQLDWEIVKDNPLIFVCFGQEIRSASRVCSACGRALPVGHFPERKTVGRICNDCARKPSMETLL